MTDTDRARPRGQPDPSPTPDGQTAAPSAPGPQAASEPLASLDQVADSVLARLRDRLDERDQAGELPSADQAIALREQAPELYELWLKIARDKAATANYVERAPYEVPERLAQSGRPRALGALVIVLSFCGYLAWLGGPGPYIGGLIAILDLVAMFSMFFGLMPDRLAERPDGRKRLTGPAGLAADGVRQALGRQETGM